ncbi:MAG: Uncharacterised protein [Synechococcus sp. MIT S9220]|nr:MAG: Uncharacterised protein [Synechococcus sp. MIT S9220]
MPLIRQRLQRLGEHGPLGHFHRKLTAIRSAQDAAHTDEVARIHKRRDLGKRLAQSRLLQKQLDRARLIRQGEESKFAHHPSRHHPTGDGHVEIPLFPIGQISVDVLQLSHPIGGIEMEGIGLYTLLPECIRLL